MANETATLAAYVADLKFADIPPEVLEKVYGIDSAPFTRLPPVAELVEPDASAKLGVVPLVQR